MPSEVVMPLPAISAPVHRLTVDSVLSMVETGVLSPDDRVELLDGVLFEMAPQGPAHMFRLTRLREALSDRYHRAEWTLFEEKPVVATPHSMPEPDLSVFSASALNEERIPRACDATLLVEVSWSSHHVDREKASLYARAGAPTYWNVDLQGGHVVEYTQPGPNGYAHMRTWRAGEVVPLPGLGVGMAVEAIVGGSASK